MDRTPRPRLPWLASLALLLASLGAPALADTQANGDVQVSAEERASLPPVDQFKDGDEWDSFDEAASLANNVTVVHAWIARDGQWQLMKFDDAMAQQQLPSDAIRKFADPRSFTLNYPQNPSDGMLFAGEDGVLHMYGSGAWTEIPVGSTIQAPNGATVRIDRRVTPNEAVQMTAVFARERAGAETQNAVPSAASSPDAPTAGNAVTPEPAPPSSHGIGWTVVILSALILVGALYRHRRRAASAGANQEQGGKPNEPTP